MNTEVKVNTGMVKWFNGSRGFGFVTNLENNVDIFAHHSGIKTTEDCWKTLNMGEYVQFSVRQDDKGQDQAISITGIQGGPLQCETRSLNDRSNGRTRGSGPGRWNGDRKDDDNRGDSRNNRNNDTRNNDTRNNASEVTETVEQTQ